MNEDGQNDDDSSQGVSRQLFHKDGAASPSPKPPTEGRDGDESSTTGANSDKDAVQKKVEELSSASHSLSGKDLANQYIGILEKKLNKLRTHESPDKKALKSRQIELQAYIAVIQQKDDKDDKDEALNELKEYLKSMMLKPTVLGYFGITKGKLNGYLNGNVESSHRRSVGAITGSASPER